MPSPQSLTEPGTSQALKNTAEESMPGTGRGDPSSPVARDVVIPARDGFSLGGTVFRRGPTSRSVVIVNSATAVPQRFYRHYAQALADAGFIVVTYDYRGTGSSRPTSLKGFEARASDWGLLDMAGVVDWAHEQFAPAKLLMIGHSVGGQVTGLLDNSKLIDGMMTISSQSGHWRLQGAEQRRERWEVSSRDLHVEPLRQRPPGDHLQSGKFFEDGPSRSHNAVWHTQTAHNG